MSSRRYFVQFRILCNRLNTKALVFDMIIGEADTCIIDCPFIAESCRQIEVWLRKNITEILKLQNEKRFGG